MAVSDKIKRFYKDVGVARETDGYGVQLDGRPVKSPGRQPLILPTHVMADEVAAEWQAQTDEIDLASMPCTRFAGFVLDQVMPAPEDCRAEIIKYAGSDLLCYWAQGPDMLVERQAKGWGPVLERFALEEKIAFKRTSGITHTAQNDQDMERFAALIASLEGYQLGGVHVTTTLTGSALLAVTLLRGWLQPEEVWSLAHLDEDYQVEFWGEDVEALERRQNRHQDFQASILALR